MIRTQIYFPAETLAIIRKEAAAKNTTLAAIIRQKVAAATPQISNSKVTQKTTGSKLLLSLAKDAQRRNIKGPKDLATNMDKYLYGKT